MLKDACSGHDRCVLCGPFHPGSWRLSFKPSGEGEVRTTFMAGSELQGYENILHGGVIASLLDAAMTHCLLQQGIQAMTGDLRIRFYHPVACHVPLMLRARLLFSCPPLYQLMAEIVYNDILHAKGEGKFMRRDQV